MTMNAALIKASLRWERIVSLGFLAGAYIALGGVCAQVVTGLMEHQQGGVKKLVSGAVFPVGLMCVLIAGGGLFTGNTAIMMPAYLSGRITLRDMLRLAPAANSSLPRPGAGTLSVNPGALRRTLLVSSVGPSPLYNIRLV